MDYKYWIIIAVIFALCFTGGFFYTLFAAKKRAKNKDKDKTL
jgi:hypothetical protein